MAGNLNLDERFEMLSEFLASNGYEPLSAGDNEPNTFVVRVVVAPKHRHSYSTERSAWLCLDCPHDEHGAQSTDDCPLHEDATVDVTFSEDEDGDIVADADTSYPYVMAGSLPGDRPFGLDDETADMVWALYTLRDVARGQVS